MEEMEPVFAGECYFNAGVACTDKKCERCGWNPAVDKARRKKTRRKYESIDNRGGAGVHRQDRV